MILFYASYAIMLQIFFGSNLGEVLLLRQLSEDETLLNTARCTKSCLQQRQPTYQQQPLEQSQSDELFRNCYDLCRGKSNTSSKASLDLDIEQLLKPIEVRKIQENFIMKLVCRADVSLTLRIDWIDHGVAMKNWSMSLPAANVLQDVIYIIRVDTINADKMQSIIYLSDKSVFTIGKLAHNTVHNISAVAVHADGEYSIIAYEETFTTLKSGYQPSKMGAIELRRFVAQADGDWYHIAAEITWEPSAEHNCFYDIISLSTDSQIMDLPTHVPFRNPLQLFEYTVDNIEFGQQYQVGLRTVNPNNYLESTIVWLSFRAPSCLDWYHFNYTLCAPLKPTNLRVTQTSLRNNMLALNISWTLPEYLPDYYTLHILDLHQGSKDVLYTLSQNASKFYVPQIQIYGASFEVHLVAHTQGGQNVSDILLEKLPHTKWAEDSAALNKIVLFIIAPICCIVMLSTYTVWKRKAKLKRYRQRSKYLEAMEQKPAQPVPVLLGNQADEIHLTLVNNSDCLTTSLSTVDAHSKLNDELEVEPNAVLLQEVLGEGAFGLVRRGVYKKRQVAVKLLKADPTEEDVNAFKCEINMLRSVGKHPNIVGIVGYSTRSTNSMMLLIEYCSLGNLQNYLREEWKYRQERRASKQLEQQLQNDSRLDKRQIWRSHRTTHSLDMETRIEDINCSMHSTLEQIDEEEEQPEEVTIIEASSHVETYTLTKAATASNNEICKAADNESYGLHEATTIDQAKRSIGNSKAFAKPFTASVENKEYFGIGSQQTHNRTVRAELNYVDLLDIAQQVAVGMEFLAQNKIVHRDLAARNVLISTDRSVKIADFGLSRDVYHENVYRKLGGGKLPIKWLALEALTHQVYSSQSDVWSFGVLLYEITTLGGMPYPSVPPSDLLQFLRKGQRMKRPEGCTDEMFALMRSCWCSIPAQRPTFTSIKQQLTDMILATGELPQRQREQRDISGHLNNIENKLERLIRHDDHYLQPLQ